MKKHQDSFALRASVMAVRGALITLALAPVAYAADAADQAGTELTQPKSTVAIGVTSVSDKSAKFGEFNGLNKKGETLDADFELRGGGAYDSDNATRFRITGTDLGLKTRDLKAEFGEQGRFRINLGYDELQRNSSDTYQTPLQGVGTNFLTMPSTWIKPVNLNRNPNATTPVAASTAFDARTLSPAYIANDSIFRVDCPANTTAGCAATTGKFGAYPATAAQQAAMLATAANDNSLFRNVDIGMKRTKYDAGFSYIFNSQWDVQASTSHETKVGLKQQSYITDAETGVLFPDPIDQTHNQFNLSLNFKNDKSFLSGAYYGSLFRNKIDGVTFEEVSLRNGAVPGPMAIHSTAPSNDFHQFSLTGGHNFTSTTKLVANASYSRATQDQGYIEESLPTTPVPASLGGSWLPANSLHGLVVTKGLDLKLTSKPVKDLNLTAAYKYNDRNNQTPVHTYYGMDLDLPTTGNSVYNAPLGFPANSLGTNGTNFIEANRALSKKVNQLNLDASYLAAKGQTVKVGYDWQKVENYCDGSWYSNHCLPAASTKEDTFRAEWLTKPTDDLTGRLSYAYSERRASGYDINAWLNLAPMAGVVPNQLLGAGGIAAPTAAVPYLGSGGMSALQTMQFSGLPAWGPLVGWPTGAPTPWTQATWAAVLGMPALTTAQYQALQYYFANGGKLAGGQIGTRNALFMAPGQQTPIDGDRNRDKLRASVNWQANEKLSFTAGYDYNKDNYNHTTAGLTDGKTSTWNLDATFALSENVSSSVFYTNQDRRLTTTGPGTGNNADGTAAAAGTLANTAAGSLVGNTCNTYTTNAQSLQNAKIDPCLAWSTDVRDKTDTLGLSVTNKGLMAGKLTLAGDIGYTKAVTSQNFSSGGNYITTLLTAANFPGSATTWTRTWVPAAPMPDITNKIISLTVKGKYNLDKTSAVRFGYTYQNLKSDDWYYNNLSTGSTASAQLPTNEKAPTYTVHVVSVAYVYSFK